MVCCLTSSSLRSFIRFLRAAACESLRASDGTALHPLPQLWNEWYEELPSILIEWDDFVDLRDLTERRSDPPVCLYPEGSSRDWWNNRPLCVGASVCLEEECLDGECVLQRLLIVSFQLSTVGRTSIWYTADFVGSPTYKACRGLYFFIIGTLQLWETESKTKIQKIILIYF